MSKIFTRADIGCMVDGNLHGQEYIIDWIKQYGFDPAPYTPDAMEDDEYQSWLSDDIQDGIDYLNTHCVDQFVEFETDCDGSICLIEKVFYFVSDIPDEYHLITDSQDIKALCESLSIDPDIYNGCFFVLVGEGEYDSVYYCDHSIPNLSYNVERLL